MTDQGEILTQEQIDWYRHWPHDGYGAVQELCNSHEALRAELALCESGIQAARLEVAMAVARLRDIERDIVKELSKLIGGGVSQGEDDDCKPCQCPDD